MKLKNWINSKVVGPRKLHITPLNEGQELNYSEVALASPKNVAKRCRDIIKGLRALLPHGSFSVEVRCATDYEDYIYFYNLNIFDKDMNKI